MAARLAGTKPAVELTATHFRTRGAGLAAAPLACMALTLAQAGALGLTEQRRTTDGGFGGRTASTGLGGALLAAATLPRVTRSDAVVELAVQRLVARVAAWRSNGRTGDGVESFTTGAGLAVGSRAWGTAPGMTTQRTATAARQGLVTHLATLPGGLGTRLLSALSATLAGLGGHLYAWGAGPRMTRALTTVDCATEQALARLAARPVRIAAAPRGRGMVAVAAGLGNHARARGASTWMTEQGAFMAAA